MSQRRRRPRQGGGGGGGGGANFWGTPRQGDESPKKVRPASDPAALLKSLGDPPLVAPRSSVTSADHLAAIYEEAVRAATALAAATGLLELDDEV
jgi:hypothetical protein